MVMEIVHEDMGEDDNMQCMNHPQKNITPGGICAFCLQEKLGKLVSSAPIFHSNSPISTSSPPPFRSESHLSSESATVSVPNNEKKSKLPFGLKKKKTDGNAIVFKRSKSAANPGQRGYENHDKRRFWSFFYLSKHPTSFNSTKDLNFGGNDSNVGSLPGNGRKKESKDLSFGGNSNKDLNFGGNSNKDLNFGGNESNVGSKKSKDLSFRGNSSSNNVGKVKEKKREEFVVVEENGSPDENAFERKVSRSKSVGCGSRSFSGDFFERISTGFGDCTLRRVESQREGKSKVETRNNGQDCIKERVRCGGIFSGLMIASSSSSSSSSSSNWVSEDKVNSARHSSIGNSNLSHARSKSWGWVLASPMRAFSKPSRKRDAAPKTTNLSAIPSLLAVSG